MSSSFEISREALRDHCIDLSSLATECRFRLVDCEHFLRHQVLRVVELSDISDASYSAISYIWRGNPVEKGSFSETGTFSVVGAEDGDPVSIDVLVHACTLSSTVLGASHLWLDRLCIIQNNKNDKHWQIGRMYQIYQKCKACLVLPGGLGRLVRLDEETKWIRRGWTLQEALAPGKVEVLFSWKAGSGTFMTGDHSGRISEVVPKQSAMASLIDMLQASTSGYLSFSDISNQTSRFPVQVRIFGSLSPNARALGGLLAEELAADDEIRDHAIWKSALLRASSRPVDMVFSIMGLFDVSLDTKAFHEDDRSGATIALAREIVNRGRCASWLGIAFRLPPSKVLSTFPIFPVTSVQGSAIIPVGGNQLDVATFVDDEYPNSLGLGKGLPRGIMDKTGYLTFTAKSIQITEVRNTTNSSLHERHIIANNNTIWEEEGKITKTNKSAILSITYAVVLGWFDEYYPGATTMDNPAKIKLMIIQEHAPSQFHLATYAALDYRLRKWINTWVERQFCLGGPATTFDGDQATSKCLSQCREYETPSYRDRQATLARWAAPQEALESLVLR